MKAIKKVEVTPIDYNIGKIIDSAATSDDKTKNTYSMRIIDGKFDKSNIKVVEGNLTFNADTHDAFFYYESPQNEKWVVLSAWYRIDNFIGDFAVAPGIFYDNTNEKISLFSVLFNGVNHDICTLIINDETHNVFTSESTGTAGMLLMKID